MLAQLFHCFSARSDRTSAFHRLFTNPLLWAAIAVSVVLQAAVVHVPVLNKAFDTILLDPVDWLICVALASALLWADEAKKMFGRKGTKGSPARDLWPVGRRPPPP